MYYWADSKYYNDWVVGAAIEAYTQHGCSVMPANNPGALRWASIQKKFITEDDMPKRICMYCGLVMGESTAVDPNGVLCDTHGSCPTCTETQIEKMKADVRKHQAVQSFDDLQKDVERRINSGFYDSDVVLNTVASKVMREAK